MKVEATVADTKKRLGRRIVTAREKAGLNQRQLAERLVARRGGAKPDTGAWHRDVVTMQRNLRRYENGHNSPRGDLLMEIAEETGTDAHHFTSASDDEEEDAESAMRRIAASLVILGEDDLAADLLGVARSLRGETE